MRVLVISMTMLGWSAWILQDDILLTGCHFGLDALRVLGPGSLCSCTFWEEAIMMKPQILSTPSLQLILYSSMYSPSTCTSSKYNLQQLCRSIVRRLPSQATILPATDSRHFSVLLTFLRCLDPAGTPKSAAGRITASESWGTSRSVLLAKVL